jgi:hypothetical protein
MRNIQHPAVDIPGGQIGQFCSAAAEGSGSNDTSNERIPGDRERGCGVSRPNCDSSSDYCHNVWLCYGPKIIIKPDTE